jgi:integrase
VLYSGTSATGGCLCRHDWQFPDRTKISSVEISKARNTAQPTKAGIDEFRLHDVRHTAASLPAKEGSVSSIGAVLGHKWTATTMRYSRFAESHLQQIVKAMNERSFGAGSV